MQAVGKKCAVCGEMIQAATALSTRHARGRSERDPRLRRLC